MQSLNSGYAYPLSEIASSSVSPRQKERPTETYSPHQTSFARALNEAEKKDASSVSTSLNTDKSKQIQAQTDPRSTESAVRTHTHTENTVQTKNSAHTLQQSAQPENGNPDSIESLLAAVEGFTSDRLSADTLTSDSSDDVIRFGAENKADGLSGVLVKETAVSYLTNSEHILDETDEATDSTLADLIGSLSDTSISKSLEAGEKEAGLTEDQIAYLERDVMQSFLPPAEDDSSQIGKNGKNAVKPVSLNAEKRKADESDTAALESAAGAAASSAVTVQSDIDTAALLASMGQQKSEQTSEKMTKGSDKNTTLNIDVIDNRTAGLEPTAVDNVSASVNRDGAITADMQLYLKNADRTDKNGSDIRSSERTTDFSAMLSDEIKNSAGEFVKTGSIILKDNNKGTINLVLHPEEFGNVKIQLELSDKVITGRIIVASEEAYNAFKSNLDSLKNAFTAGGFESTGFDLSWSGSGSQQDKPDRNKYADLYDRLQPTPLEAQETPYMHDFSGYYRNSYISVVV